MSKKTYNLHLKGYVGGWDFDSDYVDFVLNKNADNEVHVLIDSLGGSLATALSIVASFRNHGNVHVHYVGMNASAATIASLGAKHVSIDSSAMYLVHKCSMEFFQWASANADKLRSIIKEAEQMKENLDKMDSNIAEMYAKKCKKEPTDLLALMKKGGWLTAKEAELLQELSGNSGNTTNLLRACSRRTVPRRDSAHQAFLINVCSSLSFFLFPFLWLSAMPYGAAFSLIQNRTDDSGSSSAPLRRQRLQPPPQTFASVIVNVCGEKICPRKYVQPFPQVRASEIGFI